MKKTIFNLVFIAQPLMLIAAASSSENPDLTITTGTLRTPVRFESQENYLEKFRIEIISFARHGRADQKTKAVLTDIGNCTLWLASQNDATKIKPNKLRLPATPCNSLPVKILTFLSYGYRQAQAARVAHGLPIAESYLTLYGDLTTVTQEAFKILGDTKPNFDEPTIKKALEKIRAHAVARTIIKKRPRIESPTKKERKETQLLTAFFTPIPFTPADSASERAETAAPAILTPADSASERAETTTPAMLIPSDSEENESREPSGKKQRNLRY